MALTPKKRTRNGDAIDAFRRVVDPGASEFLRKQIEKPSNGVCCDCQTPNPEWASVSHGIYLSIGSSGVHRSLGVSVSRVQSITMDSWKPVQLRMMELGGNQRFADFLRDQGVPEDLPIREKYRTRAAEWYRRNLRAEAEGTPGPEPLERGTGRLPADKFLASADGKSLNSEEQQLLDKVFATPLPSFLSSEAPYATSLQGELPESSGMKLRRKICDGLSGAFGRRRHKAVADECISDSDAGSTCSGDGNSTNSAVSDGSSDSSPEDVNSMEKAS